MIKFFNCKIKLPEIININFTNNFHRKIHSHAQNSENVVKIKPHNSEHVKFLWRKTVKKKLKSIFLKEINKLKISFLSCKGAKITLKVYKYGTFNQRFRYLLLILLKRLAMSMPP